MSDCAYEGFLTASGKRLAWSYWHNFGGPCSYRVTGPKRQNISIRFDATGEVHRVTRATPSGHAAVMGALFLECEAEGYAIHCFGGLQYDSVAEIMAAPPGDGNPVIACDMKHAAIAKALALIERCFARKVTAADFADANSILATREGHGDTAIRVAEFVGEVWRGKLEALAKAATPMEKTAALAALT